MAGAAEMRELIGLGVSRGIAIGRAVCVRRCEGEVYRIPLPESDVEREVERFRASVASAQGELHELALKVRRQLGDELAEIFEAHALFLADARFLQRIEERIRGESINAEWAVFRTAEELEQRFADLDSPHLRERAQDLQDVSRYLLRSLQGIAHHEISEVGGDVVVVADDLTPSEAVRLGRQRVKGFVIEGGGETSHTAIISRSLHLPLVAGAEGITALVTDDDPMIVDGIAGRVILHPPASLIGEYRELQAQLEIEEGQLTATRDIEAISRDGESVELMANIDLPEEIIEALQYGARGIGLYRSEFLYIEKSPELPDEDEQLALYRQLLESMRPHPVIIRTYDLGGRKLAREVLGTESDNPALGLRGIRLTLARPLVFRIQLRALFRAGLHGDLWILLPMVSSVDEIRAFRAVAEQVMEELEIEGVAFRREYKLGIMIEVPSAALIADLLTPSVDFFSIGTNDLIQYSLAVDRNNEAVSYLYRPLHPAILRLLGFVVRSARAAGTDVALCGEMASDPRFTPLLLGLGIRRLSMSPRSVPAIKEQVRRIVVSDLPALVERCMGLDTAADVEGCLKEFEGQLKGAGRHADASA